MHSSYTRFLVLALLCSCVLVLLWCGQDRDADHRGREAGTSSVDEPVAALEDSGTSAPAEEAGTKTATDGGHGEASDASLDGDTPQTSPTLDGGASPAVDASPAKTETAPSSSTDAGATKTPVKETTTEDAAPASSENAGSKLDPETEGLTSLLQKVYRDVDSFEADFEQTYRNRLLDRNRESKGHVWLRPPSKMRWEYEPPSKNLIVADGRTLFVYEPEPNQVVKMPVTGSELPSVMAFLTGGRNLTVDYDVQEVHREQLTPRGQAGLELRPKAPSSVISRVVLVISRQTGKVQRTVLVEPEGNTNTFVWSNVKTDVTIPDRQFRFTPPDGVRVVER